MSKVVLSLSVVVIVLIAIGPVQAEEGKLGVTLDLTYTSKWLSKGSEAYGSKGGLFKTVDVDLYGSGFGIKVTHRNATSAGYVDKQRFDFRPYYKDELFSGESYVTNYNVSVGYEYYPGLARHKANTTYEWIFDFSWPNILPGGLVPAYTVHYEYPASGGDRYNYITGWVHRFRLGYDLNIPKVAIPLHLSSEVAYTDGLGGAAHDWSYTVFGVSTKLNIGENLTFIPAVYQQISMDKSVSRHHDITYSMLSMKYKF